MPQVIRGSQRAALERHLGERGREVPAREPGGGAVEIVFAGELEAERMDIRLAPGAQHDRMMVALLDRAQIERLARLLGDEIAEAIDIECARRGEIAHAEFDVARAHHVEWRIEDRLANGHEQTLVPEQWHARFTAIRDHDDSD